MDCVGALCSQSKISLFGIDANFSFNIYESFSPSDIQCMINAIRFHPKQNVLAYATTSGAYTLNVNNAENAAISSGIKLDFGNISCVAAGEKWMGFATHNTLSVVQWNEQEIVSHRRHKANLNAVCFLANDRYLVGGDVKGDIIVHNCETHVLSSTFENYTNQASINHLDATPNRMNWLIACNDSGFVYLFDITREKILYYDCTHNAPANSCAFNPMHSSLFVSCGLDKNILIHDLNRRKIAHTVRTKHPLSAVKYLPRSDKHILAASTNGHVHLYDARQLSKPLRETFVPHCILSVDIHPQIRYSPSLFKHIAVRVEDKDKDARQDVKCADIALQSNSNDNTAANVVHEANEKRNFSSAASHQSPISSAIAKLPNMEELNRTFRSLSTHKNVTRASGDEITAKPKPTIKTQNLLTENLVTETETDDRNYSKTETDNLVTNDFAAEKEIPIVCDFGNNINNGNGTDSDQTKEETNEIADECKTNTSLCNEQTVRRIVQDELVKSEQRVLHGMAQMLHEMHIDLIEHFIQNDASSIQNIDKLMLFLKPNFEHGKRT